MASNTDSPRYMPLWRAQQQLQAALGRHWEIAMKKLAGEALAPGELQAAVEDLEIAHRQLITVVDGL